MGIELVAWRAALLAQSRTLSAAEARARSEQRAWGARVAALQAADRAHRALLARLRRQRVHAVAVLATTAHHDVQRARRIVRPQPHGGGSTSTPLPPAPKAPSLTAGTTLSVSSAAYSLPGHTASFMVRRGRIEAVPGA